MKLRSICISLAVTSLALNTLSGCIAAVGAAGAEAGYLASQEERSVGETIDDQVILTSIKSKLMRDPDVSGLSINVDVHKGAVELRGYLRSNYEIKRAITIARETRGVRSVTSLLVLDPSRQ